MTDACPPEPFQRKCEAEGCLAKHFCKGYCRTHYERWKRHGDPLKVIKPVSPRGEPMRWLQQHATHQGDDCLIWPFARFPDGRAHMHGAKPTRVMCELAKGPAPSPTHEAAHNCGKGHDACINPGHLRWATPEENSADKVLHGTLLRGEDLPQAKLSAADVAEIRSLRGQVEGKDLAERFGVAASCISKIQNNKSWRHLS